MTIDRLEELETIRSDLQGNVELIIRTDDGEFNWDYGRELLEELLDDEIERLSVTDEEVQDALIWEMGNLDFIETSIEQSEFTERNIERKQLTIEALKAYRPVRENRTTESDHMQKFESKRKLVAYTGTVFNARVPLSRINYCPNCGMEL